MIYISDRETQLVIVASFFCVLYLNKQVMEEGEDCKIKFWCLPPLGTLLLAIAK